MAERVRTLPTRGNVVIVAPAREGEAVDLEGR
jgi:hypothetical protein